MSGDKKEEDVPRPGLGPFEVNCLSVGLPYMMWQPTPYIIKQVCTQTSCGRC